MAKKKWFEVTLETNKIIRVYAEDAEMAQEKAEEKMGPTWLAIQAWEAN